MPNWTKVKPTDDDARRMSVRGKGKTAIKIEQLPLAQALALARPQTKVGTLVKPKVTIVPPSAIKAKRALQVKPVRIAGKGRSNGVLRPPLPPLPVKKSSPSPTPSNNRLQRTPQSKTSSAPKRNRQLTEEVKPQQPQDAISSFGPKGGTEKRSKVEHKNTKRKSYSIKPFDGQSRFEGGYRIVQGGAHGQGKHR